MFFANVERPSFSILAKPIESRRVCSENVAFTPPHACGIWWSPGLGRGSNKDPLDLQETCIRLGLDIGDEVRHTIPDRSGDPRGCEILGWGSAWLLG